MNVAAVCYPDFEAKRRDYPARVIPAIFTMARDLAAGYRSGHALMAPLSLDVQSLAKWLAGGLDRTAPRGRLQLMALHELARAGQYRPAKQPCDLLQPVAVTLEQGAPCSGWAIVLGAVLDLLGYPWRLVTAGDDTDPYRHVYVQAWHGGHWYTLDAKGSERGQDFNRDAAPEKYDVVRYWESNQ
jgi:hypothetical protein